MKRLASILCLTAACFAVTAILAANVQHQTLDGIVLARTAASTATSTNISYHAGETLVLTNIQCLALGTATQNLTSVAIEVGIGTSSAGIWATGTPLVAADGTFFCPVTVPVGLSAVYWQTRLTDAATNTYYYPMQKLNVTEPLR